jgi:ribulose-phosphate 3-epimerase
LNREEYVELHLGIKSDPIEYRYSYDWLLDLMNELSVRYLQLGTIQEHYWVAPEFFQDLRERAAARDITIKSVFSAHRELGGWLAVEPTFEDVAVRTWERLIQITAWLGAETAGSSIGAVPRDRMETKGRGIERFSRHMRRLLQLARSDGLSALVIEPMSSLAEPPTTSQEISSLMEEFAKYHRDNSNTTVPLLLCPDISHGYVDSDGEIVEDNYLLFEHCIPYTCEFHIKNTDGRLESTFGFGPETRGRGVVNLRRLRTILETHKERFPVEHLVGYLEINGPKLGRDYSDSQLRSQLVDSVRAIQDEVFA